MSTQTLGCAVQPEDRPVRDELVAYFGDGNRSAYLRATLIVSNDTDLLSMSPPRGTPIIEPSAFAAKLDAMRRHARRRRR